jgi:hypothetical protein
MDIDLIRKNLFDSKSSIRRKAAIEIGKNKLQDLGEDLFAAYLKEKNDERTWETQKEMLKTLGLINYSKAINEMQEICEKNEPDSMIGIIAGEAYVRLKRKSNNDVKPAIELLKFGHHSIMQGAYNAIGYDKMLASDEDILELIKLSQKPEMDVSPQFDDPRYGLAAAAAGWKKELTESFLLNCLQAKDEPLKYVAANSLKGKYVKLR